MLVWLASYPRSGNTLFRILLHHLYGLKTCSVYTEIGVGEDAFLEAIGSEPLSNSLKQLAGDRRPHFVKTHELPADRAPAIYLIRDGRDALVSYAWFVLRYEKPDPAAEFGPVLRNLILRDDRFGGWSNHVTAWSRRGRKGRTALLRFEDLVSRPVEAVAGALDALGLRLPPVGGQLPSFETLHARWPEFFRKGKVGGWRDDMPADVQALFWERHGAVMRLHGYEHTSDLSFRETLNPQQ